MKLSAPKVLGGMALLGVGFNVGVAIQKEQKKHELMNAPCSPEQSAAIGDAIRRAREQKETALSNFFRDAALIKEENPNFKIPSKAAGEEVIGELDLHLKNCPASVLRIGDVVVGGMVEYSPTLWDRKGGLSIYPTSFDSACELVDTVVHETAHITARTKHSLDEKEQGRDWIYLFGKEFENACIQRSGGTQVVDLVEQWKETRQEWEKRVEAKAKEIIGRKDEIISRLDEIKVRHKVITGESKEINRRLVETTSKLHEINVELEGIGGKIEEVKNRLESIKNNQGVEMGEEQAKEFAGLLEKFEVLHLEFGKRLAEYDKHEA
ncbi:MAG: hypothetical protein AAB802_03065 [Patescibacteria group bacterium]